AVLFSSCMKQDVLVIDENYWMSKERGVVVFSSSNCPYYVVQTNNGYDVLRSINYRPLEGDVIYGDLSYYGTRDFYDRTDGTLITSEVKDYWLTYNGAQDAINYYCY